MNKPLSSAPGNKVHSDTIMYIGEDLRYWTQLQIAINSLLGGKMVNFKMRRMTRYENLPTKILKLIRTNPKVIYLDFAKNPQFAMAVGKLLRRLNATKEITVIALFDYNADPNLLLEVGGAGIFLSHLKGIEIHDIAYDATVLMYPKENVKCKFVTAQTKRLVDIIEHVRIKNIARDALIVEGNAPLEKDDEVSLYVPLLSKVIPSRLFKVKEMGETDLYYDFLHWYKLSYQFVDPLPPIVEGEDKKLYKIKEDEHAQQVRDIRIKFDDWLKNNATAQPICKVLMIDKRLRLLKEFQELKIQNPLGIRYQLYLSNIEEELRYYQPHIIIFGFDPQLNAAGTLPPAPGAPGVPGTATEDKEKEDAAKKKAAASTSILDQLKARDQEIKEEHSDDEDNDDELEGMEGGKNNKPKNLVDGFDLNQVGHILKRLPQNDDASLEAIVAIIKKIPNYTPVLVAFSNWPYHSTEYFKTKLQYSRIVHDKGVATIEKLIQFEDVVRKSWVVSEEKFLKEKVERIKKTNPNKFKTLKSKDIKESVYYFKKRDPRSFIQLTHRVTITSLSESEMELESTKKLRTQTVYQMPIPTKISITPILETSKKDGHIYRCLIHSAGEKEKSAIRQFINDIFLASRRKERESESAKFVEMNDAARKARETQKEQQKQQEAATTAANKAKAKPSTPSSGSSSSEGGGQLPPTGTGE
ncbi:MAG: hypothetical protein HQK50_06280 [Oligoflexia bacterium]|nr:hypothetical protein [Oligoflexia bacterium]MBF0365158.1 hypothetical protein [Oligoflexia bacterium]